MIDNTLLRYDLKNVYIDETDVIDTSYEVLRSYKPKRINIYYTVYSIVKKKLYNIYDDFILFEDDRKDEFYLKDKLKKKLRNIKTSQNIPVIDDIVKYFEREIEKIKHESAHSKKIIWFIKSSISGS